MNKMHGIGTIVWVDGRKYTGVFLIHLYIKEY